MSIERLLALALLVLAAAVLFRLTPSAILMLRTYLGTGRHRQQDATGRAPEAGPDVVDRMAVLATLGYHALGETRTVMPTGEVFCRIVAADDGESYAILVEAFTQHTGLTGLYTAWPDGTWLGTLHPHGDPLVWRGLELGVARGTLAEAVTEHRAGVERLRAAHGPPRRVERMADMLAHDADYRQRFGGRELRPLVARALLPAGVALALTAAALVLVAVIPR